MFTSEDIVSEMRTIYSSLQWLCVESCQKPICCLSECLPKVCSIQKTAVERNLLRTSGFGPFTLVKSSRIGAYRITS